MAEKIDLVVYPGDGIGPSLVDESIHLLDEVSRYSGAEFRYHYCQIGDEVKQKTGAAIPQEAAEMFREHRIALKGPVGESVGDFVSGLRIRFELNLNLRPVRSYPRISPPALRGDIDLVIVRENMEDVYVSRESEIEPGIWRFEGIFTKNECDRIARYSFDLARSRKRRLAVGHKSNILRGSHGLFLRAFHECSKDFPDVVFESYYADALAAHLVRRPQDFDVVACPNMIGDILSDVAAEVGGGLGLVGSANLNTRDWYGLFEPVHGSAPDIAGKNIADPISQIRCLSLLFDFLGKIKGPNYTATGRMIEQGVAEYLSQAPVDHLPAHLGGKATTHEVASEIMKHISLIPQ